MLTEEMLKYIGDKLLVVFQAFATEHASSNKLYRSIKYKINGNTLTLTMAKHAIYLDQGTKPHMPPVSAIKKWARHKGLNEWAVAMKIKKYGTKAHPFLYKFNEVVQQELTNIEKLAAKEIKAIIIEDFYNMTK